MDLHELPSDLPEPVERWARALRQLAKGSGYPSVRQLARALNFAPASLSRYLKGERPAAAWLVAERIANLAAARNSQSLPHDALRSLWEQAVRAVADGVQDQAVPQQPGGPASQPAGPQPVLQTFLVLPTPPRRGSGWRWFRIAVVIEQRRRILAAAVAVIFPCLWASGSFYGRSELLPPASSSATSAPRPDGKPGFFGHAVLYRQLARLVLFDDAPDGRASIADIRINGKPIDPHYNSHGLTDPSHPPHIVNLSDYGFEPSDTIEYQVCAGQTANRGEPLKRCGQPVIDRPGSVIEELPMR